MLYALICTDKPGALAIRKENRPAHVEFLEGLDKEGRLKMAGPLLDDNGDPMGSLVLIEADSAEAAENTAAGDPYAKAGLFARVEIRPFNWLFKNPEA